MNYTERVYDMALRSLKALEKDLEQHADTWDLRLAEEAIVEKRDRDCPVVIPGVPRPCPICGGSGKIQQNTVDKRFAVCCTRCGTMGPLADSKNAACRYWNRRKT